MDVTVASINLDHIYAKNHEEKTFDSDILLGSLGDWSMEDDDLFSALFSAEDNKSDDILNILSQCSPKSDSSCSDSSDSYLTPISPDSAYLSPDESFVPSPSDMNDPSSDGVSSPSNEEQPADDSLLDVNIDLSFFNFPDEVFNMAQEASEMSIEAVSSNLLTTSTDSIKVEDVTPVMAAPVATATGLPSICPPTTASSRKTTQLVLTEEEQKLLSAEGVVLPTDTTLTKAEEKMLKKVRRKIKNKQSAQESRRKKKCYMDGLESRVKCCTEENRNLQDKVKFLEKQNKSLLEQLKQLQRVVANTHPNKTQTGTCLMVLMLAFGLVFFPTNNVGSPDKSSAVNYAPVNVRSRTLLQVKEDYPHAEEGLNTGSKYNSILNVSEVTVDTKFVPPSVDSTLSDINVKVASHDEVHDTAKETMSIKSEKR